MSDASLDKLRQTAEQLTGGHVAAIERAAASGGNSRIYRIIADGKLYALKRYPVIENDNRDRLNTERMALQFFEKHNIDCVPRWIAGHPPFALLEWVEGKPVTSSTGRDIEQAVRFLSTVFHLSAKAPGEMPAASEACLSGAEIVRQIERRLERLQAIADQDSMLSDFLENVFLPALWMHAEQAQLTYPAFGQTLAPAEQRLIPADFGFHNALRTDDNRLIFIDFEYFGWDDPVKVICDFLLHPAMRLDPTRRAQFRDAMLAAAPTASARFSALYPLFGLRWTLILLNEFLPERWEARALASGDSDWETVKRRQLKKAQAMLAASKTDEV